MLVAILRSIEAKNCRPSEENPGSRGPLFASGPSPINASLYTGGETEVPLPPTEHNSIYLSEHTERGLRQ
jgi:hypothetical protein